MVELCEQATAVVARVMPVADLRNFFAGPFRELGRRMAGGEFTPSGVALAFYRRTASDTVDLELGFSVRGRADPSGSVAGGRLPGGRAVTCLHLGNYESLADSWGRLAEWAAASGLAPRGPQWEIYVTEPRPGDDPADMVTEL